MESQEEKPSQKPRTRLRSILGQLQRSVDDCDQLLDDPKTSQSKKAAIVLQKSSVLLRLAELQSQEARDSAVVENETLTTQREKDVARIAELEEQLAEAEAKANTRTVEKIPDPETPILRKLVETLTAAIASTYSELDADQKACIVVKAALKNFDDAKPLMKIFNIEPSSVHATLKVESLDLQTALMTNPTGQFAHLNRAVLSLRDGFNGFKGFKGQRSSSTTPDFMDEY